MLILTIRTDKPEAELRLYDGQARLAEIVWHAHRELAETIHIKIKELLTNQQKQLGDIDGIVAYQGPGSFTGLRIGLSVGNALADGLHIPIVAGKGGDWEQAAITRLEHDERDPVALPEYGAPVHITTQKK